MAKITAVEPDWRRPGSVRVMVDGKLFCTVDEAAARAAQVAPGMPWDEPQAQGLTPAADEEAAWRAALKALGRRGFSVAEMRRRLRQRGHPPAAVEGAIGRGVAAGLLDDSAFAGQYVASRAARGRGPARLRRDLLALGVAPDTITAAISAHWPEPEDALALARELVRRRARQLAGLPADIRRRRLLAYLNRRGFAGRRVQALVARAVGGGGAEGA